VIDPAHFDAGMFRICAAAQPDAARLHHPSVGTEHFLGAIMGDTGNGAKRALERMGVTKAQVLHQLLLLEIPMSRNQPPLELAPIAHRVLAKALEERVHRQAMQVLPDHLLLAMCVEECAASHMLGALGLYMGDVWKTVAAQLNNEKSA
jgi:ATP-dependent Clp protease ATP-binding subunit ClpC